MSPESRRALMEAWREDCKVLAAGGWPRIPSPLWTPLMPLGKCRVPLSTARRAEESAFIARVIARLYERGWLFKQIAPIWGFTLYHTTRLYQQAKENAK